MRRKLIVGNWKMNGLRAAGKSLAAALAERMMGAPRTSFDLVLCPPATLLRTVSDALGNSLIAMGGQDCHHTPSGAHTGDISAEMLADMGCSYVVLGHSERRQDHYEDSQLVADKASAAHDAGLIAIICVGESESERSEGKAKEVVAEQVKKSIPSSVKEGNVIIAYEPVWAIGTGKTASIEDIAEMHEHIRKTAITVSEKLDSLMILYGGSVKPDNAEEILGVAGVDGALVGSASLKADDFWAIAQGSPDLA